MKRTFCLLPFVLAAPVYCADNSDLVNLLPAGTQVAFGIKVHAVLNSELAKNLTAEIKGQVGDWQKLSVLSGFDPMTDLDEILIGSTGAGEKPPRLHRAGGGRLAESEERARLIVNAHAARGSTRFSHYRLTLQQPQCRALREPECGQVRERLING